MNRCAVVLAFGILGAALISSAVLAQAFGPRGPGPEPANNRETALRTGRQLVGIGGQCLDLLEHNLGTTTVMRPCDPNAMSQRFKYEDGRLRTAGAIVVGGFNWADKAWQSACVGVGYRRDNFNWVTVGFCQFPGADNYERQRWTMNGREIRGYHNECLDVSENRTDNGAPVIFWGCHGRTNQQWVWR